MNNLTRQSANISFQPTEARTSPRSTLAQPTPVSSAADIILLSLINPPLPIRPNGFLPTGEVGPTIVSLSRVQSTWNVRILHLQPSQFSQLIPLIVYRTANPNGAPCYGLTPVAMVHWIYDFSAHYRSYAGRYPVIYTTTSWWKMCTGNSAIFAGTNPLWIARYASSVGPLPGGWGYYTFWQYATQGPVPGDQNYYNGSIVALKQ